MFFFRRKSIFVLLIGVIVFVVLIGFSLTNKDEKSLPERLISDAVGWIQQVFHVPVNYGIELVSNVADLKNTFDENKILRKNLAEYKSMIHQLDELDKENEELRGLLDIQDSSRDFEPISASVISRSPERWLEFLTINKGKKHGIEKNMAVITADGMVGKVQSVSNVTATVQLITGFDQLNQVSAMITRKKGSNIFGLIEGFEADSQSLIFRIIEDSDEEIEVGELVVSSNMGGLYPSGLPIGTIKDIKPDEFGLAKIARVKPSANLAEINQVIVVDRQLDVVDGSEVEDEEVEEDDEDNGNNEDVEGEDEK